MIYLATYPETHHAPGHTLTIRADSEDEARELSLEEMGTLPESLVVTDQEVEHGAWQRTLDDLEPFHSDEVD